MVRKASPLADLDCDAAEVKQTADYLKPTIYTDEELKDGLDKERWCVRCGARSCLCLEAYT
jgi:hypothetical protein